MICIRVQRIDAPRDRPRESVLRQRPEQIELRKADRNAAANRATLDVFRGGRQIELLAPTRDPRCDMRAVFEDQRAAFADA